MAAPESLFGRDRELQVIDGLIDRIRDRGDCLVVSGEPGIGKSALLNAAHVRATERGLRALRVTGVEPEARLAFAGLHQLLQPVIDHIGELASPQRDAMFAAFGKSDAAAPDLFLTALGALGLLAEAAESTALIVIAEDAHWLDRSTSDVLAFIARRVEYEPILVLAAIRDGFDSPLDGAGLPRLPLTPLSAPAAAALLDSREPGLPASLRERVLEEAAGNPLALVELPVAFRRTGKRVDLPRWLPLTTRLERAFAARLRALPEATRIALLVAAVNDAARVAETLAATAVLLDAEPSLAVIDPAVTAELVDLDGSEIRFRHPLVRAAVHQEATVSQRHAAHAALASVLGDQHDRCVWHRAAAAVGSDEGVARELEAFAEAAQGRGAVAVALAQLERAAELSDDSAARGRRLLRAAELGFELGRADVVQRLLDVAAQGGLARLERVRLEWLREVFFDGTAGDSDRVLELTRLAAESAAAGEVELAVNLLFGAAMRCFWADQGDGVGELVAAQALELALPPTDARLSAILGFSAPASQRKQVLGRLEQVPAARVGSPYDARWFGMAAQAVGDFALARAYFHRSAGGLRDHGRLGLLAHILVAETWGEISRADWDAALPIAEEATRMARETRQPIWAASPIIARALIAGARGMTETAEQLVLEAQQAVDMTRQGLLASLLYLAQGVTALSAGAYDEAYGHLSRLFDRTSPAYPYRARYRAISYLAESAIHAGRRDEARAALEDLEQSPARDSGSAAGGSMVHARALLAEDARAEASFQEALRAIAASSPFELARLRLAYGSWLRRQRRMAESRVPLREARDAFDALGALPWGERARQELRASGESSRRRVVEARDQLTPQELQIAQLAARGLTNREIGQMLYLSHRTISSHLYKVFPKLGVTSRAELRNVLERGLAETASDAPVTGVGG